MFLFSIEHIAYSAWTPGMFYPLPCVFFNYVFQAYFHLAFMIITRKDN